MASDRIARFRESIERLQREGVFGHGRHDTVPWGEASAGTRLDGLLWAALDPGASGPPLPDDELMNAVDRHVDAAGLSPAQRERLDLVRAAFAAGRLDGGDPSGHRNAAYDALRAVAGIEHFERGVEQYKRDGLYNRPANTPWADVPEAKKVDALVGLAEQEHPPGTYALAAIEREVDYSRLPEGRRAAFEGLRARIDAGELEGPQPRDLGDRANYALRLAEFEQRVEDYKRAGDPWQGQIPVPWATLAEVRKLDLIVMAAKGLHLHFEPREYEVIDREVDLARVPAGRRRGIEAAREMTRLGPEEYERRRQAPYAPPNEAAAAFKERIEEGLWRTCFTDGATIFADWSDLTAESKLYHLASAMDWEQVPESYFRTMVERELTIDDLPAVKRSALDHPRDNRHVFTEGFEEGFDAPESGTGEGRGMGVVTSGDVPWDDEQREARIRELFDTANRVQLAEFLEEKALDPGVALRPASEVREIWYQHAESTWVSFREEAEWRSDAEIRETLAEFKTKEAGLPRQEPLTLIDHLREAGLFEHDGAARPGQDDTRTPIRDTTRNLVEAIWLDTWPRNAAVVDFGLRSQEHYEALYYGVRAGEITPEALDATLGKGQELTALARSSRSNPHRDITFGTDWDLSPPESGREARGVVPSGADALAEPQRLPSPSQIIADPSPHLQEPQPGHDNDRDR